MTTPMTANVVFGKQKIRNHQDAFGGRGDVCFSSRWPKASITNAIFKRLGHAADPSFLPMASARRAIGISLVESFWRAIGNKIDPF